MDDFVHLHVHSEFSLLDSSCKIMDLVERAHALDMNALAITDHGVMYGCLDFFKACERYNIKAIIGCEIYVASKSRTIKKVDKDNFIYHLVLLVKNETGYKNLLKIVSESFINGFYYKPRIDIEFLKDHSEGLIALSACLSGGVSKAILKNDLDRAKDLAKTYKDIFKDDFYLELQNHGLEDQIKVNKHIIDISKELSIDLVATNDVHYIRKSDSEAHDVLICIQTGATIDSDRRMKYEGEEFYLKSKKEMHELFKDHKDALENTLKIRDKCNFRYEFGCSIPPKYIMDNSLEPFDYLKRLCYQGIINKYEDFKDHRDLFKEEDILDDLKFNSLLSSLEDISKEGKDLLSRMEYEMNLINSMGFVDYFLIVWDFMKFCRDKSIPTGPGRGSVAGSIVAYILNITKIDPIKYGLIFERFLNPERISMPDIDSDFCNERREEVISYVKDKYGHDKVAHIVTFGTMAARASIRDVGRAINYPYGEVDKIAKMIPNMLNITIDLALLYNKDLKDLYEEDLRVKRLIDIARKLEGLPRHTSVHAAGVIISPYTLDTLIPMGKSEDMLITGFPMGNLEELGLLKMDFLGLRTLTVIDDSINMIKENRGISLSLDSLDFNDKSVFDMLGEGKTCGVFQLESSGMTSFMRELRPSSLEDIIAGISLYRPGPMDEIPNYIKNKNSPDKIVYKTKELKDILEVTYGVIVYQEQVMEIVQKLSGYSLGRSDLVRRAMAKKKHEEMEKERKNFVYGGEGVDGCIKRGIKESVAHEIFDQMIDFASYAFNKSHAAAYAVVAYETAYLMKHFKSEFICSLLNSVINNTDKIRDYIRFSESLNIKIFKPCVNESKKKFVVKGNDIYFGLSAIKNLGEGASEKIVYYREKHGKFKDEYSFFRACVNLGVNKKGIESMIKCGALDTFNVPRSYLLLNFENILEGINKDIKKNVDGQMSLFSMIDEEIDFKDYRNINVKDDINQNLSFEREILGLYISGHPIFNHKELLDKVSTHQISDLYKEDIPYGETLILIGGCIGSFKKLLTKSNSLMGFLYLEDRYSSIECVLFPRTYEKFSYLINDNNIVIIRGIVKKSKDELKVIANDIIEIDDFKKIKLYIICEKISLINTCFEKARELLSNNKGEFEVIIHSKEGKKSFKVNNYSVNLNNTFICELNKIFGKEAVKVVIIK